MAIHLSCREASRLISAAMDRRLFFTEKIALRLHLLVCDACTRFTRQLEFMRRALERFPGPDDPDKP
jgi:putative zinc finger protein